jgi:pantoate kinase
VLNLESKATAFSPAHITGFFQIFDQPKNPLFKGSRGAGVSLTKGAKTTVRAKKSVKKSVKIRINGKPTETAEASKSVAEAFLSLVGARYQLVIEHEIDVPIGCGLGSSGAGALSLALALNEALGLGLSRIEAAQIAHVAEVKHRTGLGTVISETFGGMEIRVKPGAPGIGEVKPVTTDSNYVVACLPFGPLSTRKALSDPKLRRLINRYGGKLVDKLVTEPKVGKFLELSRGFAELTSLTSERVSKVLADADNEDFLCSMAIFGETVFSVVRQDEAEDLLKIFRRHKQPQHDVINAQIDFKGARILR